MMPRQKKQMTTTERLNGYMPEETDFDLLKYMFHNADFIECFGVELSDEKIKNVLEKDISHWNKYAYGALTWFDKNNHTFIGRGGLNHTIVENREEIELTYSLCKAHWGKGLAVEIGQYAINYAFNLLNLENIVCFTTNTNKQSLRVIEKLGFIYEKDFVYCDIIHKLHRLENSNIE